MQRPPVAAAATGLAASAWKTIEVTDLMRAGEDLNVILRVQEGKCACQIQMWFMQSKLGVLPLPITKHDKTPCLVQVFIYALGMMMRDAHACQSWSGTLPRALLHQKVVSQNSPLKSEHVASCEPHNICPSSSFSSRFLNSLLRQEGIDCNKSETCLALTVGGSILYCMTGILLVDILYACQRQMD